MEKPRVGDMQRHGERARRWLRREQGSPRGGMEAGVINSTKMPLSHAGGAGRDLHGHVQAKAAMGPAQHAFCQAFVDKGAVEEEQADASSPPPLWSRDRVCHFHSHVDGGIRELLVR
jgi:hypothetical protein